MSRLNGWKEIASHFGKSVRTVQRWERDLGLPVHRLHTAGGEIVFAHAHELEAWERRLEGVDRGSQLEAGEANGGGNHDAAVPPATGTATPPSSRRLRWAVSAVVVAGVIAVTWLVGPVAAGQPSTWSAEGNTLTVFDESGSALWSHRFSVALDPPAYTHAPTEPPAILVDDLDGDGRNEVLVLTTGPTAERRLRVFEADGSLRFATGPGRAAEFGDERIEPPFGIARFLVAADAAGRKWIWANFTHNAWFPSCIQKLAPDGQVAREYWANGHQNFLGTAEVNGRPVILLGGTSNDLLRATLTVLDVDNPSGSAPAEQPEFECTTCPAGRPLAYLAFPRTELTELNEGFRPTIDNVAPIADGGFRVAVRVATVAVPGGAIVQGATFYTLDADLRPIAASTEDDYRNLHSMLRLRGVLDHDLGPDDEAQLWPVLSWNGERFEEIRAPGGQH